MIKGINYQTYYRYQSQPRPTRSREKHAGNINRLLQLQDEGYFKDGKPLDPDRLNEDVEPFMAFEQNEVRKCIVTPSRLSPRAAKNRLMMARTVLGSPDMFKQGGELLQKREEKRAKEEIARQSIEHAMTMWAKL